MHYRLKKTARLAFISILKAAVLLSAVVFVTLLVFSFTSSSRHSILQWVIISFVASMLFFLISLLIQHINYNRQLLPPANFDEDDEYTSTFIINTSLPDAMRILETTIPLSICSSMPKYDSANGIYTLRTWDSPLTQAECIFVKLHALNTTKTMISVASRKLVLSNSGGISKNSQPVKKIRQVFLESN